MDALYRVFALRNEAVFCETRLEKWQNGAAIEVGRSARCVFEKAFSREWMRMQNGKSLLSGWERVVVVIALLEEDVDALGMNERRSLGEEAGPYSR